MLAPRLEPRSLAHTRGEIRVVTYNIGLKQDQANRGKNYGITVGKYKADVEALSQSYNVICVQELSAKWAE